LKRNVRLLGVPLDMGAGRRGVDMGASALRLAGLERALKQLGHTVEDSGNIDIPVPEAVPADGTLPYSQAIATACRQIYDWCTTLAPDDFPIVLGGDHSLSMGSISGFAQRGRTGVIWVDAHTDINTPETSDSGNIHGMPLAHLLGYGDPSMQQIWGGGAVLRPADIVYIGVRSVDGPERHLVRDLGIRAFTMKNIDERGIAHATRAAIEHLSHHERIHLSFDVDVLDPSIAPGVGTPVRGGLNYREAHLLMELLCECRRVTSMDIAEVNPILDIRNITAEIAVEMTGSLLGQAIM